MAFDPILADRVLERLGRTDGIVELKMFGAWGATIHGNMAVGVMGDDLIVRVGPEAFAAALARPGARPFDFTGRAMTGWVYVDGPAVTDTRTLNAWVDRGVAFAQSLPPKSATKRRASSQTGER